MTVLSFRERNSKVWQVNGHIYKSQPKYLMDNECWCLDRMAKYLCVPEYERLELELIRMELIVPEPITDIDAFMSNALLFVRRMKKEAIRHGDLTRPHVFPVGNRVVVIDWAESRMWGDPRPDKRPEGDIHWMKTTAKELILG
jgi:RIO-like serine/threonine protein kinase